MTEVLKMRAKACTKKIGPLDRPRRDRGKPRGRRFVTLEGDVGAEFKLPCASGQGTCGSERGALNGSISEQPCRVIRQIEGLRLDVHVDVLEDGYILGDGHIERVPFWTVDVIQIA